MPPMPWFCMEWNMPPMIIEAMTGSMLLRMSGETPEICEACWATCAVPAPPNICPRTLPPAAAAAGACAAAAFWKVVWFAPFII